jgi:hypothetical protein
LSAAAAAAGLNMIAVCLMVLDIVHFTAELEAIAKVRVHHQYHHQQQQQQVGCTRYLVVL